MWAAALILIFIGYIVLSVIPLVKFIVQLLAPFVSAGIAIAADQQRRTGKFELGALLVGFKKQPASLLAVSGVVILAAIVFVSVLAIFIGTGAFGMMLDRAQPDPSIFLGAKFWWAFLAGIAVMLPVSLATYLAPQLIVLHAQPAVTAMKMSLIGCLKNILPGIVFFLCSIVLVVVSMIPLFLGLLITIPIMILTSYTVYRDIFVEEDSSSR